MDKQPIMPVQPGAKLTRFPDYPPRDDLQSQIYLHEPTLSSALVIHLGNRETTVVGCEYPLAPSLSNLDDSRIPDMMVAFDCDEERVLAEMGYVIENHGKPPDFVLDIAPSEKGWGEFDFERADYVARRADYERYGVGEFWRLDPSGGRHYDAPLAGDRLVGGEYQPIHVEWLDDDRARGYSRALGLYICWEYEELRLCVPGQEGYLLSHYEEVARANAARARVDAATKARMLAEARAQASVGARVQAKARADAAAERRRMEDELRRFRERFGDLGDEAE